MDALKWICCPDNRQQLRVGAATRSSFQCRSTPNPKPIRTTLLTMMKANGNGQTRMVAEYEATPEQRAIEEMIVVVVRVSGVEAVVE
jgi:hypothetical protein